MNTEHRTEEIRLQLPWGHIAAKTWGSPQGTRVLVAHGILDNAGSFDRIIPLLPKNFYYVVVDLPGHGFSSPLPLGIQLDYMNYVLAIRLILDWLGWEKCIYLGHSFGSQLGMFISILYPERITKLMCLDGFLPLPVDGLLVDTMRLTQDTAVQALSAQSPPLYSREEILYALKNRRKFPLNTAAAEALFHRATSAVGDMYKYNRDFRLRTTVNPLLSCSQFMDLIGRVTIPVFIVLADASWVNWRSSTSPFRELLENIPANVKVITIPGNHDVHNNNPEVVAPHVRAFLTDTGKSKL